MANRELIEKKMRNIAEYIGELEPILEIGNREIVEEKVKLRTIERLIQLIVDTAVDINEHIISEEKFTAADDYQSTFLALGEKGILPETFAKKIAPSVGLRNAVVHQYEKIDLDRMLDAIRLNIADYREYIKLIGQFLKR